MSRAEAAARAAGDDSNKPLTCDSHAHDTQRAGRSFTRRPRESHETDQNQAKPASACEGMTPEHSVIHSNVCQRNNGELEPFHHFAPRVEPLPLPPHSYPTCNPNFKSNPQLRMLPTLPLRGPLARTPRKPR